jgi:hypothetical protein
MRGERQLGQSADLVLAWAHPQEGLRRVPETRGRGLAAVVLSIARTQIEKAPSPRSGADKEGLLLVDLGHEQPASELVESRPLGRAEQRWHIRSPGKLAFHQAEYQYRLEPAGPRALRAEDLHGIPTVSSRGWNPHLRQCAQQHVGVECVPGTTTYGKRPDRLQRALKGPERPGVLA